VNKDQERDISIVALLDKIYSPCICSDYEIYLLMRN